MPRMLSLINVSFIKSRYSSPFHIRVILRLPIYVNLKFSIKHLNVISNNVSEILNSSLLKKTLKFRKDFFRVVLIIPRTSTALNEMQLESRDFPDCLT